MAHDRGAMVFIVCSGVHSLSRIFDKAYPLCAVALPVHLLLVLHTLPGTTMLGSDTGVRVWSQRVLEEAGPHAEVISCSQAIIAVHALQHSTSHNGNSPSQRCCLSCC